MELSVEKRFFDTTDLNVGIGYRTVESADDVGNQPFITADLRYPLWVSRRKLERTREDIFRQNELNDTQLAYIQESRRRLRDAMSRFYDVDGVRRFVKIFQRWLDDLEALEEKLKAINERDVSNDLRRLEAEKTLVRAEVRNMTGRYEIKLARLKAACGLPFHAQVELLEEPFNPFEGFTHEALLRASIDSDPEIQTLRNAVRNAEVQLDLARRGQWDIALQLSGNSSLEGRGADEGVSDWSLSVGLDVSAVDPRVTESLIRQAQANINRFTQAIAARENAIFTNTLDPIVRIDTLSTSREELIANLPRFVQDYEAGIEAYVAGTLNIDDLLKRLENVLGQEADISSLTSEVGSNVAALCSATGKFFELLNDADGVR